MSNSNIRYSAAFLLGITLLGSFNRSHAQFFENDKPTDAGQNYVAASGLRLVGGRDIEVPDDVVLSRYLSCATVSMLVGKDGVPISFTPLDAIGVNDEARRDAIAAIVEGLSQWRFAAPGHERRLVVPYSFSIDSATASPRIQSKTQFLQCASPRASVVISAEEVGERTNSDDTQYPYPSSPDRLSGCVVVTFDITREGLADGYEIVSSNLPPRFVDASLQTMNGWRFKPVASTKRSTASFIYEGDAKDAAVKPTCLPPPGASSATEKPT